MATSSNTVKEAFEAGVQFAYRNGCKPVHPNHLRSYALKAADRDCFVSGYLKVIKSPSPE